MDIAYPAALGAWSGIRLRNAVSAAAAQPASNDVQLALREWRFPVSNRLRIALLIACSACARKSPTPTTVALPSARSCELVLPESAHLVGAREEVLERTAIFDAPVLQHDDLIGAA